LAFAQIFWLKMKIISHFDGKKQPVFGMVTQVPKNPPSGRTADLTQNVSILSFLIHFLGYSR
jgi:hypothetical protein